MNELREMCDRMVVDAPPMPDGATVLASARRSVARRRLGVGAMVSVVVAAAAALTVPLVVDRGPVDGGPASVAAPAAEPEEAYAKRMTDLLVAAVPAGYTSVVVEQGPPEFRPVTVVPPGTPGARASAGVYVTDTAGRGMLSASFWPDDGPARPVCADRPPGARCEDIPVGAVVVTVLSWANGAGRHVEAFRKVTGGDIRVVAMQAMTVAPAGSPPVVEPGLAVFPFTEEQIAALAADPGMVPPV